MAVQLTSATHLLLYDDDDSLLMLRRFNTGYQDGNFSVVAGHIEPGESARQAMKREALEEAAIDLNVDDLEFAHAMHRQKSDGTTKLDIFFRCTKWSGDVTIAEPDKCDLLAWRRPSDLPANTVPYIRAALNHIQERQQFSEFGWGARVG